MSLDHCVKLRVGLVCLLLIGLFVGGCADCQSKKHASKDAKPGISPVISCDTVFYRTGPQQAMPPDGKFKAGTRIEVIQEAGSYTLVRAQDGREGYVSADAITVPKD